MTRQRHPRDTPSNPHGTAPHTRTKATKKNDDSVQARPLTMSRFDLPEPGPVPKRKMDDSMQGGPFKKNRVEHGAAQTTALSAIPKTRRHPDDALISNP